MDENDKINTFLNLELTEKPINSAAIPIGLNVFGDIWEESLEYITSFLHNSAGKDVEFIINSGGGSVFDGIAIASMIQKHKGETIGTGIGFVASIASVILLANDKVRMQKDSFLMIHNASMGFTFGESGDLRKDANLLDKISDQIANIYVSQIAKNGKLIEGSEEKTKRNIKELMDQETWFNAEQAFKIGLIDSIIESSEKENILTEKEIKNFLNKFGKKAPKQFLNKFNKKMEKEEIKNSVWDNLKALFKTDTERAKAILNEVEEEALEEGNSEIETSKQILRDAGYLIFTPEEIDDLNNSLVIEQEKVKEAAENSLILNDKIKNLETNHKDLILKCEELEKVVNGPSSKPVLNVSETKKISDKESILNKIAADSNLNETLFFKNLNS